MKTKSPQPDQEYLDTLLEYYEDEIKGDAYFAQLATHLSEPDKVMLLAKVERCTAEALRPLIEKYALAQRNEAVLAQLGRDWVGDEKGQDWKTFIDNMVSHYPSYIDDCLELEAITPDEDLPIMKTLTEHQVLLVEFAKLEQAGNPDSAQALRDFIAKTSH